MFWILTQEKEEKVNFTYKFRIQVRSALQIGKNINLSIKNNILFLFTALKPIGSC